MVAGDAGATLLSDPQVGVETIIEEVTDIYIYFQTYAYAGNEGGLKQGSSVA